MHTIIITTINNSDLLAFQEISKKLSEITSQFGPNNWKLVVIGDRKTPKDFQLNGCEFYGIQDQLSNDHIKEFACILPENHYSRKNIGYVLAKDGEWIVDTDDDNIPFDKFWDSRTLKSVVNSLTRTNNQKNLWINPYSYFYSKSEDLIWPRGFPLDLVRSEYSDANLRSPRLLVKDYLPIQQGLADLNPDVDAIYRLLFNLPYTFKSAPYPLALNNYYCPFNSQNTSFHRSVFPLLYLPSTCSFRMTDIYRSYIACRVLNECGCDLVFANASVYQERNSHNLLKDFSQECDGQINVHKFIDVIENTSISNSISHLTHSIVALYSALIDNQLIDQEELAILNMFLTLIQP